MPDDLRRDERLLGVAERLLLDADAIGVFPTPVARLIEVAGLSEPERSLLSDECIESAPEHLAIKMRGVKDKVLAILDRCEAEVHLRPDISTNAAAAFKRLHEVGHHIIPWQAELAYADDRYTLSHEANALFELEASQVSAELLFQRNTLRQCAASSRIRASEVISLSSAFGASIHATFRRYVETHHKALAGVVLGLEPVCVAPPCFRRQEAFCSERWGARFQDPRDWPWDLDTGPLSVLSTKAAIVGTMVATGVYHDPVTYRMQWPDLNGELTRVRVEIFTNHYSLFVMLHPVARRRPRA